MEKIPQPTEFERKKTAYFSNFAARHLSDMRILRKGGILGEENRDWRNVSEHCLTEAVGADVLAEHLHADRKKLVTARTLEEKIMHYLDMITSGSTFVKTFAERLEPIVKKPHNVEFSESYRPRYKGRSLFEVQQTLFDEEQKEFEEKLGIPAGTLTDFILKKIEERINAQR